MKLSLSADNDTPEKRILRAWSEVLARGEKDTYARVHESVGGHVSPSACKDIMNALLESGVYPNGAEP